MLLLTAAVALAVQANPTYEPRKAFAGCVSKYVEKSLNDRADKAAFEAGLPAACAAEEDTFRKSLIAYDIKMKQKRSDAESNAGQQVEDYRAEALIKFEDGQPQPE